MEVLEVYGKEEMGRDMKKVRGGRKHIAREMRGSGGLYSLMV